jgi:hypothetical protein
MMKTPRRNTFKILKKSFLKKNLPSPQIKTNNFPTKNKFQTIVNDLLWFFEILFFSSQHLIFNNFID